MQFMASTTVTLGKLVNNGGEHLKEKRIQWVNECLSVVTAPTSGTRDR